MNPEEIPTVSVADLPTGDLTLLDVREHDEWVAGHAPGAVHIPLGELPAHLEDLAKLPDDRPIHVVCRTGGRSARATAWLIANGWDAVNVAGGMKSWLTEGRPVVGERGEAPPEVL